MTQLAWLALRAASLALLLQAAGTAIFLAIFAARLTRATPAIRRHGARVALGALAVLAGQYLLEPVYMAGEWAGIADGSLHRLVLGSSTGAALMLRAAGMTLIALGLRRAHRAAGVAALAGSVIVIASFLVTGHTVVAAHRPLLASLLSAHLAVVAFWFGALVPLRQILALEPGETAVAVIEAFSSAALWLVPLIPLAGIAIAALLLPDAAALLAPYGLLLGAKLALFAVLLALAALNRLRLTPALARDQRDALPRLRASIAAEYWLIWAVLAVTAVLTGVFSPAGEAALAALLRAAGPGA